MNTLPTDLVRLVEQFFNYIELATLSSSEQPRRCNTATEAIMTNNWPYINSLQGYGCEHVQVSPSIYQVPMKQFIRDTKMLLEFKKYINQLDPNYGPPLSLLQSYGTFFMTKENYMIRCKSSFKEAIKPVSLPLVIHTPMAIYKFRNKEDLRYEPVVGSVCAINRSGYGDGSCDSWVVTNVITTKTKERKIKEILLSRITFINSTSVVYDADKPKLTCKFYTDVWDWSSPMSRRIWTLDFDRYVFDEDGYIGGK